ncbi:MAG: ABC transporter ATP-binding protein [bacterium]
MKTYRRLLQFMVRYKGYFGLSFICMGAVALAKGGLAWVAGPLAQGIFLTKDKSMLTMMPVAILTVYIFRGLGMFGQAYFMALVSQRTIRDIQNAVYEHLLKMSLSFFVRNPTGILMSRITNDVNLVQESVSKALSEMIMESMTIVTLFIVAVLKDPLITIIFVVILPISTIPVVRFGKKLRKISTRTQVNFGIISSFLHETITGIRIVKAFAMETYENKRFRDRSHQLYRTRLKSNVVKGLSEPIMDLIEGIGVSLVIYIGGSSVISGRMDFAAFTTLMAAIVMMYSPVKKLSKVHYMIQEGMAAADRIFGLMDQVPEIQDSKGAMELAPVHEGVVFDDVYFRYGDRMVIQGVSLTVKPGEVIALVGASGEGKTTLVNLVPRFYDVTQGAIRIDGRDIRDVTMKSLRSQIAMVTQETILFNDTVRNNIAYGLDEISKEEVIRAASAANAHSFIMELPEGYDTVIGESGMTLSGGQRQRVSIARALIKDAPILILDEATSALDTESEHVVQEAINNLMKGRTTFVIAHRLSTVTSADRILVIQDGKIAESGRHEELLKQGGIYRQLYERQFKDEQNPREDPAG